jgi:hypothetical protein
MTQHRCLHTSLEPHVATLKLQSMGKESSNVVLAKVERTGVLARLQLSDAAEKEKP